MYNLPPRCMEVISSDLNLLESNAAAAFPERLRRRSIWRQWRHAFPKCYPGTGPPAGALEI